MKRYEWLRTHLPAKVWNNLATVSVLGLLAVLTFSLVRVVKLSQDGKQAHDAICALKGDLSQRIISSKGFLRDHPRGIPGLASAATIRSSIANQQATLQALHPVKCSAEE